MIARTIRLLIVDDSRLGREVFARGFVADPEIEVVGTAADAYDARDSITALRPDVLLLDTELPRIDSLTLLRLVMPKNPLPVVMISSTTPRDIRITLEALEMGAVDFITTPSSTGGSHAREALINTAAEKIKIAATARVGQQHKRQPSPPPSDTTIKPQEAAELRSKVIVMAASTGGVVALQHVLASLPSNAPGILLVHHMPDAFTKVFVERLNKSCRITVKMAELGDHVISGRALMAPGGRHMKLQGAGPPYSVVCRVGEKVNGYRPSIDVLMHSVARLAGPHALGVLLTGAGHDGARGLQALKEAGAVTFGQDEESCLVYGLSKAADALGAVDHLLPLDALGPQLIRHAVLPPAQKNTEDDPSPTSPAA